MSSFLNERVSSSSEDKSYSATTFSGLEVSSSNFFSGVMIWGMETCWLDTVLESGWLDCCGDKGVTLA